MSKEKIIITIKITAPVLAAFLWLLLYFTVLWRLPFTCNLNRVKLPKDCKEIETNVIWTDLEIVHIKAERVFSSERSLEELEDYINNNNNHLGRIDFGWWSCPEYDHADAVSPDDHLELPWDGTETYYVLTYSTWGIGIIDISVFLAGIISAVLAGALVFFLMGKIFPEVKIPVTTCAFISGCWLNTSFSPILGVFTLFCLGVVVFLLLLLIVFGFVFGIIAWKKGGYKVAVAGIWCSSFGLSIAVGSLLVYFLIAG